MVEWSSGGVLIKSSIGKQFIFIILPLHLMGSSLVQGSISTINTHELARSQLWIALGHYRKTLGGAWISEVDGSRFFLSPEGKTSPRSELQATLNAFMEPEQTKPHAQCRFPARFQWLVTAAQVPKSVFPDVDCPEIVNWKQQFNAQAVSLIFASSYLNNSASMFGHTILKFHTSQTDDILNYGVDFSAEAGRDGGLLYILKGLWGGYPGRFSLRPYHVKLRDYNNIEGRDLWEYRLKLSRTEVDQLLNHLLELEQTYFSYFFLDENCSYRLLTILEVLREGLSLSHGFRGFVLPSDTIRRLARAGLIEHGDVRVAPLQELRARLATMNGVERRLLRTWVHKSNSPLMSSEPETLDAALLYASLQEQQGHLQWRQRAYPLKKKRATMGPSAATPLTSVPLTEAPETGHASSTLHLGGGHDFAQISFRPAYHVLLNAPAGYLPHSELEVLHLQLRHQSKWKLQSLNLLSLKSYTPINDLEWPWSWETRLGVERPRACECDYLSASVHMGLGYSLEFSRGLIYVMARSKNFVHPPQDAGYQVGAGLAMGAIQNLGPAGRLLFEGEWQHFWGSPQRPQLLFTATHNLSLMQNLEIQTEWTHSRYRTEMVGSFAIHF